MEFAVTVVMSVSFLTVAGSLMIVLMAMWMAIGMRVIKRIGTIATLVRIAILQVQKLTLYVPPVVATVPFKSKPYRAPVQSTVLLRLRSYWYSRREAVVLFRLLAVGYIFLLEEIA